MENPFDTLNERLAKIERLISNINQQQPSIESPLRNTDSDLIDVNVAAELTGYEKSYLYELKHKKKIPYIQRGKRGAVRFSRKALIAWMESGQPDIQKELMKNLFPNPSIKSQ